MAFVGRRFKDFNKPKRILIIVENLSVPFDRRVWLEATALQQSGYKVRVICPRTNNQQSYWETLEGVVIYRHPLPYEARNGAIGFALEYTIALVFQLILTLWIAVRYGVDAIHACNPPDTLFMLGRLLRPFRVKFVFDQHDINPELYLAKYNRVDVFYRLLVWLERQTYKAADIVISTNQSYRNIALCRGRKSPDDVFVVRSAPDSNRFHAVIPEIDLKQDRPFLVAYLGVMGKQEGLDLLLKSIHYLVNGAGRRDISFVLIGSGPEMANLIDMRSKLHLDHYVTFTGRIPDSELLTYLSTADVCVNPDRYNAMNDQSTMNKIMEYMAVGKPIVQFDLTEGRYSADAASLYAAPDDTVDFANQILNLLENTQLRETMGRFGLARFQEKLDWRFSKKVLLEAYTHLFDQASTGR